MLVEYMVLVYPTELFVSEDDMAHALLSMNHPIVGNVGHAQHSGYCLGSRLIIKIQRQTVLVCVQRLLLCFRFHYTHYEKQKQQEEGTHHQLAFGSERPRTTS